MKKVFILFLFSIALILNASYIESSFSFNSNDITIIKENNYDMLLLKGCGNAFGISEPALPTKTETFILPIGCKADSVIIVDISTITLDGNYNIYPIQKNKPISYKVPDIFNSPNNEIYSSSDPFPVNNAFLGHQGNMGGNALCGINVCPFIYYPALNKLEFISKIKVRIFYSYKGYNSNIHMKEKFSKNILKNLVSNTNDIDKFISKDKKHSSSKASRDSINYFIITTSDFDTVFTRLAEWKTKKGIPTQIVTADYIYSNYSGTDNAEQIRNFIIDAHSTYGSMYFLLAGQSDFENSQEIIPRRDVYYLTSGAGYYIDEDTIISDLYFADLDGTWNADGDGTWGERTDSVDMYADVFVGRAPILTIEHAQTFVNKVLMYEKTPDSSYMKKMMLPAAILWSTYQGDTIGQNIIADMSPAGWEDIKMYERRGELSHNGFLAKYNEGAFLGHLVGHGNESGIYYETDAFFNNTDADTLSNMPYINILNSIGCMCGATDYIAGGDCFGEKLVNNPDGGALAVIFNSRFGWGAPPNFGPSEEIDSLFYHTLFYDSIYTLGALHNISKNGLIPNISWFGTWAWCIYELNLFGDPELDVFTDYPQSLTAAYDDVIPLGNNDYEFNVTDLLTSATINNARICIMNDSSYAVGYTDINGDAAINIDILSSDSLDITITAHNYFPYEDRALVASGNPNRPTILSMPKCISINILTPEIIFRSTDNENDNILYLILYDNNASFSSPDSVITALYASGDTASFIFPSLSDSMTYYYKIRAKDPTGSNYWSLHSGVRSFTTNTGLGSDNCAFYQHNNYQFAFNSFTGTQVQGDSIVLINNMGTGFDSLYSEDFESGAIPAEWTIINPNGDAHTWRIASGAQSDLGGSPPSSETYFVYYSDDDAGSVAAPAIESAMSPAIYVNGINSLTLCFSYTFRNYEGEEFSVDLETFNGSWNNTTLFSTFVSSSNIKNFDISSYMPAESIRVIFNYDDNGNWGWAAGFDNILFGNEYPIYADSGSFTTAPFAYIDLYNIYARTNWGYVYWLQSSINDSIIVKVQYCDSNIWNNIPDVDLPGNSTGFTTIYKNGSIDLTTLNEAVYDTLRLTFCMFTDTLNPDDIPSILEIEIGNLNEHLTGIKETNISAINTDNGILLRWKALDNNMNTNSWIIKRKDNSGNIKSFTTKTNNLMDNEIKAGMKYNYSIFNNEIFIGSISIIANKLFNYSFNLIGSNPGIYLPTIRYSLPVKQFVNISLYDVTGRNIATPISKICNAGIYNFSLSNLSFVSGTYFVIYKTNNFEAIRKFTILK